MVVRIRSLDLAVGKRREGSGVSPNLLQLTLNRWRFRILDLDPASMSAPVPHCGLKHERRRTTL